MKLCATCQRPINRGGSANTCAAQCIVCRTAEDLRDWHYPASQKTQRKLRVAKGKQ